METQNKKFTLAAKITKAGQNCWSISRFIVQILDEKFNAQNVGGLKKKS